MNFIDFPQIQPMIFVHYTHTLRRNMTKDSDSDTCGPGKIVIKSTKSFGKLSASAVRTAVSVRFEARRARFGDGGTVFRSADRTQPGEVLWRLR